MVKRCDADDLGNLKSEMNVSVMRHLTGFLPWQRLPQGHELISMNCVIDAAGIRRTFCGIPFPKSFTCETQLNISGHLEDLPA
jgi:hypothetical protein